MRTKSFIACLAAAMCGLLASGGGVALAQPSLTLDPSKAVTQYQLDVWTADDGLPQDRVSAIIQTQDGYIWLGTQEGLVRFDGLRFTLFDKRSSGLQNNSVTSLRADRKGSLWIGTRGGLSVMSNGVLRNVEDDDGNLAGGVSSIDEDRDGTLWIGTYDNGLFRYQDSTFVQLTVADGLSSDKITVVHEDQLGNLWIGTRDAGFMRFHAGKVTSFMIAEGLPSNDIALIFGDRDGALWVGTRNDGLVHLQDGRLEVLTTEDGLPTNSIQSIAQDAEGTIWIGTIRGGLSRYRDGSFVTFSTSEGLSHNNVLALLEDREGSLWIGTESGGLNRLWDGKFTTVTTREGLSNDKIYGVYEDREGAIWLGSDGGGAIRLKDGKVTVLNQDNGLGSNTVISIAERPDGSIWFGTLQGGVNRLSGGIIETFTVDDGLPHMSVYALYEDSRGILWMGTGRGLVRYDGESFKVYDTTDGLSSYGVTAIREANDGGLWVGTYNGGLNLMRDGKVIRQYGAEEGLRNNYITALYGDDEGTLWIGTAGGGLSRISDGVLTTISTDEGLFSDKVFQILEDDDGFLWMSCNRGLFRVSRAELNLFARGEITSVTTVAYGRSDGMKSHEFNGGSQPAGWKGRDGKLWFPTGRGVVAVNPDDMRSNVQAPPIVIEQVLALGEPVSLYGAGELAPGRNKVEFRYVGLSFIASEKVQYRYKLDGVDDEWIEAGTRREAFYTNLAPGSYTFRVLAQNSDGVWSSQPAVYSFRLAPFFYQTTWFLILCVLGGILAGIALYRLRVRQMKVRQAELEDLVDERTRDLREEKDKTERAKTVIEAQAAQLMELDKMKTLFFNNISHEFRTPLTLNIGPLENALAGLYGPLDKQMRMQVEIMLRNSRRLLRLINQLLDLAKLETGKMKLKARRGDLVQLLQGIVVSFSGFAEKKDIPVSFHTEVDELRCDYDPEGLEKVFFNLLSNAIKFTPDGGRIDVELRVVATGEVEQVEVRVRDTGAGIPAEDRLHIFDRFHQVEGSSSNVQQGTGIGLSLVKELVELHDGSVEVESELGVGTEFIVVLPVRRGADTEEAEALDTNSAQNVLQEGAVVMEETEEAAGEEENQDGVARPLVLAVDDNPDIRSYVSGCLSGSYRVITAVDGADALEKARARQPDLIISDVQMPRMSGYDLCRAVRGDAGLNHIPIILLTSRASVDNKIEGLEAGADDYLTKPFNAEELFARVRNLLILRDQQKALKVVNEALRDASELKSQMLRIAAHDLKNPLNNIREFAKLIKEEIGPDVESAELLDLIENASNQMLNLISQMLEAEILESGELQLNIQRVNVDDVASAVVQANRHQAERKSQRFVLSVASDGGCVVDASPEWLQEAMENLVSNAVKYSPKGKPIRISVSRVAENVQFSVQDEGPGLTEQDRGRLFRKFQRLSARPTGGESSTGLGLSIVKQIVEMHGGEVLVKSEHGQGSTFTIALPVASEAVAA